MVAFETMVIEYIRIEAEKWIRWCNIMTIHRGVNGRNADIGKDSRGWVIVSLRALSLDLLFL